MSQNPFSGAARDAADRIHEAVGDFAEDAQSRPAGRTAGANPLAAKGYSLQPWEIWGINYYVVNYQSTTGQAPIITKTTPDTKLTAVRHSIRARKPLGGRLRCGRSTASQCNGVVSGSDEPIGKR